MDHRWYGRITNICLLVVVSAALLLDRFNEGSWKTFLAFCMIISCAVSLATYFYNQYLLDKEFHNTDWDAVAKEEMEDSIKHIIKQSGMTEAQFVSWTNGIWRESAAEEVSDDEDN